MRVLWLCNVVIPQVCDKLGIIGGNGGGWLNQLADLVDQNEEIQLGLVAPYQNKNSVIHVKWGKKSEFFGFRKEIWNPCIYDESIEKIFQSIINRFRPDIVHIFGTEFPHTLAMVRAFNNPDKTVIHIQGLVSVYAKHYYAFLPERIIKKNTFRDFIKGDNIEKQREKFQIRGQYEIAAIKNVNHVMGRTNWDYECTKKINPNVKYHYVQEMMREPFYHGEWKYEKCEKHSIFMSQGNYPIKGLHIMLRALKELVKKYPDIRLYIAGMDITDMSTVSKRIRASYYQVYIINLIKKWKLGKYVHFTGNLNAQDMKEQFLKANVFVSASSIDNSPNSIGEAMLLGVPVVSSDVGGVSSILEHGKEGYLYPAENWKDLVKYVDKVFMDGAGVKINKCAQNRALAQYHRETIVKELCECYKDINVSADK